jgi:hypothetical protein
MTSACVCHPGTTCDLACLREDSRFSYLLAELHCAALRARLWHADIEAVTQALRGGLIEAEQAVELLAECECLHLLSPERAS